MGAKITSSFSARSATLGDVNIARVATGDLDGAAPSHGVAAAATAGAAATATAATATAASASTAIDSAIHTQFSTDQDMSNIIWVD